MERVTQMFYVSKFTLGVLCEDIIAKRGPARMRNFSQKELNKVCGNLEQIT